MPNTARVMQLGENMTSVVGEAEMIPAPFMFESSGINKWKDTYYCTYSSNFYDGTIKGIEADLAGVETVKKLNSFEPVQAETMAWNTRVKVEELNTDDQGAGLAVTEVEAGDWIAVSSVDFENGASECSVVVASELNGGKIEVRYSI